MIKYLKRGIIIILKYSLDEKKGYELVEEENNILEL